MTFFRNYHEPLTFQNELNTAEPATSEFAVTLAPNPDDLDLETTFAMTTTKPEPLADMMSALDECVEIHYNGHFDKTVRFLKFSKSSTPLFYTDPLSSKHQVHFWTTLFQPQKSLSSTPKPPQFHTKNLQFHTETSSVSHLKLPKLVWN